MEHVKSFETYLNENENEIDFFDEGLNENAEAIAGILGAITAASAVLGVTVVQAKKVFNDLKAKNPGFSNAKLFLMTMENLGDEVEAGMKKDANFKDLF